MTPTDSRTSVEPHPDQALDRALAGDLSATEQHELDQHLSTCRACAAWLAIAQSARRAREPQPWDNGLNRIAVENVVAAVTRTRWPRRLPAPVAGRWAFLTVGVLLGLGGLASAARWYAQRAPLDVDQPRETATPVAPRSSMARAETIAKAAPPETPIAASAAWATGPGRTDRAQPSAAGLFQQAAALSARGRLGQSLAVYRELQRRYPGSRETRLSFALAGRMLLDRGRPALALAQFERHLALNGEVSEEALAGRALALRRLGRSSAERQTWQRLLEAYPATVYANQARKRLSALQDSSHPHASRTYPSVSNAGARDPSEDSR